MPLPVVLDEFSMSLLDVRVKAGNAWLEDLEFNLKVLQRVFRGLDVALHAARSLVTFLKVWSSATVVLRTPAFERSA